MQVLVSDSSVLIELSKRDLFDRMFQLRFPFAVPDLLLVDCFALALAHHHGHTLLTEDRRMRAFAQDEGIPHHDLLWIIDHMHQAAILTTSQVVAALEAMHEDPRCPVPKQELARRLRSLNE